MKDYYSPEDFIKSPKYDAHIHYHTFHDLFVRKAEAANLRLLSINTNLDFPLSTQYEISKFLHQRHPETFNFIGSFDASKFASKTFAEDSIEQIKKYMAAGARGIKIWKNVGMVLKNEDGQYIMVDDPVFDPIFAFLEKEKIPLLAHLGEPRICWLPLEDMTINACRKYFRRHPNYHMYLHPEAPSHEQHIIARDHILERYPGLIHIGAHLGSMEWSLEEVAKRLDKFPNFYVDLAGRFEYIFFHTLQNRNSVIDFFQTYQNRIVYGGWDFVPPTFGLKSLLWKYLPHEFYLYLLFKYTYRIIKSHWLFLATDAMIKTGKITNNPGSPEHIKGLRLSKNIVDRIFFENARCVYFKEN